MEHPVKYDFSRICRGCINRKYNLRLRSKDCYYLQYPAQCKECGEVCNIVAGVSGLAKLHLLVCGKKSKGKILTHRFKPKRCVFSCDTGL